MQTFTTSTVCCTSLYEAVISLHASQIILLAIRELIPQVFSQHGFKNQSWDNEDLSEIDTEQPADSLACLSYIVFVQDFGIDCFPVVFK